MWEKIINSERVSLSYGKMMPRDLWTKKAIGKATQTYKDSWSEKDIHLSMEEFSKLAKQLPEIVYFAPDEKILHFGHFRGASVSEALDKMGEYEHGDLIVTSNKLLYGEHPITKVKKGLFSSEKTVHHDSYLKPIALKIDLNELNKAYIHEDVHLHVEYTPASERGLNPYHTPVYILKLWGGEHLDAQVELERRLVELQVQKQILIPKETRDVYFKELGWVDCPIYRRSDLVYGSEIQSPAIIEEFTATTIIPPHFQADIDRYGNILISRK